MASRYLMLTKAERTLCSKVLSEQIERARDNHVRYLAKTDGRAVLAPVYEIKARRYRALADRVAALRPGDGRRRLLLEEDEACLLMRALQRRISEQISRRDSAMNRADDRFPNSRFHGYLDQHAAKVEEAERLLARIHGTYPEKFVL
jgi:hypothetical protein